MKKISQSDFDKAVSHTIRVELTDGNTFQYDVTTKSKQAFQNTLMDENHGLLANEYIWFYIPNDRLVFINKKIVIRITFCFEPTPGTEPDYIDNFSKIYFGKKNLFEQQESEKEISLNSQLIVMHHRQPETTTVVKGVTMSHDPYFENITFYSSLNEGDVDGFEFYFNEEIDGVELLMSQYLQFTDDDGEENFMPFNNLGVIEIDRSLILTDKILKTYLG